MGVQEKKKMEREMSVCTVEGKGGGESMCSCEDNRTREERECLRILFFFSRANPLEKSDLEVVNCTLKSSLSAGDLPRNVWVFDGSPDPLQARIQ